MAKTIKVLGGSHRRLCLDELFSVSADNGIKFKERGGKVKRGKTKYPNRFTQE